MTVDFSDTLVGGIQDVAALLPLLGTQQCEEHTGSALNKGFLYASTMPISIFGSLGLAKAGFNIFTVSVPWKGYILARCLADGGFVTKGAVAPLIALDPKHTRRFLAESRLLKLVEDEHIEDVEKLSVELGEQTRWISGMVVCSLLCATIGLTPYLHILLNSRNLPLLLSGWVFPVMRVLSSTVSVVAVQLLLQLRIIAILKMRLIFLLMQKVAQKHKITLESEWWDTERSAEGCLWTLHEVIKRESKRDPLVPQITHQGETRLQVDPEECEILRDALEKETQRQFPGASDIRGRISYWTWVYLLQTALLLGTAASVVGYITCFYLVKNSQTNIGPYLWIGLEGLLSIVRIAIWGLNPGWDDHAGIIFKLKLSPQCPLVTCHQHDEELQEELVVPMMGGPRFLREVTTFTGPLSVVDQRDVALYYASTGDNDKSRVLYVAVLDYQGRACRLVTKRGVSNIRFTYYVAMLEVDSHTGDAKVITKFEETKADTHVITSDTKFMEILSDHYDDILQSIGMRLEDTRNKEKTWCKTWALKNSEPTKDRSRPSHLGRELPERDHDYLKQGSLERRRRVLHKRLRQWVEAYIAQQKIRIRRTIPKLELKEGESVTTVHKYEVNDAEFLMISERKVMEGLLCLAVRWWNHVVMHAGESMASKVAPDTPNEPYPRVTQAKLKNDVASRLERRTRAEGDEMKGVVSGDLNEAKTRIAGRDYQDETTKQEWGAMPDEVSSFWDEETGGGIAYFIELVAGCSRPDSSGQNLCPLEQNTALQKCFDNICKTITEPALKSNKEREELLLQEINRLPTGKYREAMLSRLAQQRQMLTSRWTRMAQRIQCQAAILASLRLNVTPDDWREAFWGSSSINERLRVIFDSESGYLKITGDTWNILGGTSGVVQALRTACRSTTVLDISDRTMDVTECQMIAEELKSMPELSSVIIGEVEPDQLAPFGSMLDVNSDESSPKLPKLMSLSFAVGESEYLTELNQKLRARTLNSGEGRIYWENVIVTDYLRAGEPYLLFRTTSAKCIIQFIVEKEGNYEVKLRHCFTTSGSPSCIAMTLNGTDLVPDQWCCDQRVRDNFADEVIKLGYLRANFLYTMEIFPVAQVEDETEIVVHYWLSNVYMPQRVERGTD